MLFCNVTAGIGILEQAAPMIQDFFREGDTSTAVAAAAAAGFVGVLSLFNMAGRFAWSSTSDIVGRKNIYMLYLGAGMVLYLAARRSSVPSNTFLFVLVAGLIISFYGGGFATVPAYLRDLFGTYQVGAIHGRLLTAWAAAGVAGPLIINGILDTQGEPGTLIAADYRPALITMVCVLAVGFVANLLITPVDSRFHEPESSGHAGAVADAARPTPTRRRTTCPASAWLPVAWAGRRRPARLRRLRDGGQGDRPVQLRSRVVRVEARLQARRRADRADYRVSVRARRAGPRPRRRG